MRASAGSRKVEQEHGVAYGKRLTRTRETVGIVRGLFREGRVQSFGDTIRIGNVELWYEPRQRDGSCKPSVNFYGN
jgi:alkanesulfonate monooxygenase SsuD/methylene tetrahydromethanopterin reductase-like flavin-dependent oxidoreductase (luciferase family)